MNTDTTDLDPRFSLISYHRDFRDRTDDSCDSECIYEEDFTLAQLEEMIRTRQGAPEAYYRKGYGPDWEFLILYQGFPLSMRGESFDGSRRDASEMTEVQADLAIALEDMFSRLRIASEVAKQEASRLAAEKAEREMKASREREQARRYADALETIKLLGPKFTTPKSES